MATYTLLQLVQSAMNSMDSDYVTDIDENEESKQIKLICKEVYESLINREEWEFLNRGVVLTSPASASTPTEFTVPTTVRRLSYVAYNVSETSDDQYRELAYVPFDEFLRLNNKESGANTVLVTYQTGLKFTVRNDRPPMYYTSIDDSKIICDSYKATVDTYLTVAKLSVSGYTIPTWTESNNFTPDLPAHMFPIYRDMIKQACHEYFKQAPSAQDKERILNQITQLRRQSGRMTGDKQTYYRNTYGR